MTKENIYSLLIKMEPLKLLILTKKEAKMNQNQLLKLELILMLYYLNQNSSKYSPSELVKDSKLEELEERKSQNLKIMPMVLVSLLHMIKAKIICLQDLLMVQLKYIKL